MATRVAAMVSILLMTSMPAFAQDEGVTGWGSAFVAPGIAVADDAIATLHFGGGGAVMWPGGFGVGGEIGYAFAPQREGGVGVFSPGVFYQFRSTSRTRPFVRGGYALLFGQGNASALHVGGGVDRWFNARLGMSFEVRDYILPEQLDNNLLEFRVGVLFRERR